MRDNRGDLIMAFSVPVTSTSNNMIEELAIEFRVKWCSQRGYTNFILELDSLIIANMLINKATNFKIEQILNKILSNIGEANIRVNH